MELTEAASSLEMSRGLLTALSHSTTCSTGELDGANDSVLSVDDFEAIEAEGTDLDGLTKTKLRNVDEELFGDFRVRSTHLELAHFEAELTPSLYTFSVTSQDNGYFHYDRLVSFYLKEVQVQDSIGDRVELKILQDSLDLTTFDVEVNSEDVWRIDEVTYAFLAYGEVEYFVTSVEDCGDLIPSTETLRGLLAELVAELTCELECLHSLLLLVVLLKISVF